MKFKVKRFNKESDQLSKETGLPAWIHHWRLKKEQGGKNIFLGYVFVPPFEAADYPQTLKYKVARGKYEYLLGFGLTLDDAAKHLKKKVRQMWKGKKLVFRKSRKHGTKK